MSEANRVRKVQLNFRVTEREKELIEDRMQEIGTTNREAYMRKMALDGYILRLEIPELKEYVAMQRVHSKRFNEIAKRVNETGRLYPEDVAEMKEMVSKLKEQMDLVLTEVNKLKVGNNIFAFKVNFKFQLFFCTAVCCHSCACISVKHIYCHII